MHGRKQIICAGSLSPSADRPYPEERVRVVGACWGLFLVACGARSELASYEPPGDAGGDGWPGDATVDAPSGSDSSAGDVAVRDAPLSDAPAPDAPIDSPAGDAARIDSGPDATPCSGPPGPAVVFAPAAYCDSDGPLEAVAARDLDGDGHVDLVAVAYTPPEVLVYFGAGDGTFASPRAFPVSDGPASLAIADFDGDGRLDLAVGHESNTADHLVSVRLAQAGGGLGPERMVTAGGWPRALAAADLNGDTTVDLAVGDGLDDDVTVLLGNGDGTFRSAGRFGAGPAPLGVAALDWNADGTLDLAVSDQNFGLEVLLGRGDGTFAAGAGFDGTLNGGQVVAGDLNCDGRPDLVAANMRLYGGVTVVTAGATPVTRAYRVGAWGPFGLALADLNGDGNLDLATACPYTTAGDQALYVLPGNGDGTFGAPQDVTASTYRNLYPWTAAAADLDEDGRIDLAVADGSGPLTILLNRTGESADAGSVAPTAGACSPPAPAGIHAIVTLAQGQSDPFGVAVDDAGVYWTNFDYPSFDAGTVMSVPKSGGAAVVLATGQGSPGELAVDTTSVYWADYNGSEIASAPLAGGGAMLLSNTGAFPGDIQVDATRVYWGDSSGLIAAPLLGGSSQVLCCGMTGVSALTSDATNLYASAGDLLQIPKSGAPPVTLAAGVQAYALAVDGQNVYWITIPGTPGGGEIWTKSIAGSDLPRTLATGLRAPESLLCDGVNLYWLDSPGGGVLDGAVMSVPVAGGVPTPVAWGQRQPVRIAADATRIYWTERLSGRVNAMAK
jgi:hypothetical protein